MWAGSNTRVVCKVRGGAVTVSFSNYLPCQAMHFLQRFTHFSETCCRPLITSKFLASEVHFRGWKAQKSHRARSRLYGGCSNGVSPIHFFQGEHRIQFRSRPHAISGLFQPWKGSLEARNSQVINGLQHVSEKWVERCKKCIACQGRYFEKERPSPTSTKSRLGVIRWIHELFKRPSPTSVACLLKSAGRLRTVSGVSLLCIAARWRSVNLI
jgi:hypothetical protein